MTTYYDAARTLQENGWTSVKFFNNRETWAKNDITTVLVVKDLISKELINSILVMA